MRKIYALLLIAVLFAVANVQAQVTVTITGGTNTTPNLATSYTSFANFVTALNGVTAVSGSVTATLSAGQSETAPVKGFNISTSTANVFNTTNTLTIVKAAGGATVFNAGTGTAAGPAASPDGIMYLSGMDGVTIDGITFTDGNSASATVAMEFGLAFFKRGVGDGCNNNTVQNCIFNMQRINNATASGPMFDGSWSIQVLNSTPAAATTALTPTNGGTLATNGTNSNNRFYTNTCNGGNGGIALSGFAATAGVGPNPTATTFLGDLNNDIGGTGAGTGNTVLNYGGGAAANPAAGIRTLNQWSQNISYNTIDNNNGSGVNHAITLRGIFAGVATSAKATISNNTVTVRSGATTSALTAIESSVGATAVSSNTVDINNNTIRFSYTTATTGVFTGITNTGSSAGTVNINSNNIQQLGSTNYPSTGTIAVIVGGSPGGPLNMTNNTISNFVMTSATTGTLRGITSSTPTGLSTITGNTIENLSYTNAASTGSITGIYNLASATLQNINNNIIRNFSTPTTGTLNGIQNNTVAGTFQCKNNQIYNFSTTAGGAGGFSANGITWSNATVEISGNLVYAINSTGSTGGTAGTINGITFSGAANAFNNAIYDLSSTSTGCTINGLVIGATGTNNVYNNLIGDLRATKSTGNIAISGILVSSGTTNNIFHNTVYIASTTTSATTFGTSAIYFSSGTTNNLRNNVFVNVSDPGPTGGFTAAIRFLAAPTTTNFPVANNNNLYYAGVAAANKVLYGETNTATATNGQQTLSNYKTYISTTLPATGRESSSVSENPVWQSTTGSNPITNFLKYNLGSPTQIEQGGITGTGIGTDFSGTVRCPTGGCPGAASTPDMGAWELGGTLADLTAPSVSFTALANGCTAGNRTFTATITDASGVPTSGAGLPVINWRINAGAYTSTQATHVSGNQYSFSLGTGSVAGDVVSFYIAAQDNNGNVGATPSGGESGVSTFPPAFSTPPTTPSSYTVLQSLAAGTYTVGSGGTYATLTAAIADYNLKCVSGAVIFELLDATYSTSETFPIILNENPGSVASAANTLTIRPASGVNATITGTVAGNSLIRFNGADRVTINGSNNNTTSRNLTIINTGTTSPTTAISLISLGVNQGSATNTIKNCNISTSNPNTTSSYGIAVGGATPGTAGNDNDNIVIENNNITSVIRGVYVNGNAAVSSGGNDNVAVSKNIITVNTTATNAFGIQVGNTLTGNVNENTIDVVSSAATAPVGISLETGTSNTIVNRNKIVRVLATNTGGYGGRGITVGTASATSNITISNNLIYGVDGSNWSTFGGSSSMGIGIGMIGSSSTLTTVAGGINLWHNSVNLYGTHTRAGANITAAIYIGTGASALDIRNNVFVDSLHNTNASGSGSKAYSIYSAYASGGAAAFTQIDYNDYFTPPTAQAVFGYINGADVANLAAWQAITGKDANSRSQDPQYQNRVDLRPSLASPLLTAGFFVGVEDDFTGLVTRDNSTPTIGAYELGADVAAPAITHVALGGTCATTDRTFTATITDGGGVDNTASLRPRLYFRKGAGTWYSTQGSLTAGSVTNGTWTFTSDYSQFGGVATGDNISYYIIAQDVFANIASSPAAGLVATDVNTVATPPTTPNTYGIQNTLTAGTYTVGAGGNFTTLTAAVNAYNTSCLTGSVVFALTDANYSSGETFPITIQSNPFASGANQLIIKPATGVTSVNISGNATAILKLNGARYVTINGSNNLSSTKDLTITNSSTTANSAVIWVSSQGVGLGANNNTISNVNVVGADNTTTTLFGIYAAGTTIGTTATGSDNDDLIITNNKVGTVYYGIYVAGTATDVTNNLTLTGNIVGDATDALSVGAFGISVQNATGATIDNNTVFNLNAGVTAIGIRIQSNVLNSSISKNNISDIAYTGTGGFGGWGIQLNPASATANLTVANNFIYDMKGDGWSSITGSSMCGIVVGSTGAAGNIKIYNNSVNLFGNYSRASTNTITAAIYFGGTASALDVRNNIFSNSMINTLNTAGKAYAAYSAVANTAFTTINNNIYYSSGTQAVFGYFLADVASLSAWQAATAQDANSFGTNPQFTSNTNLHLSTTVPTQAESGGVALAGITTDFDGDLRFGQPGYAGTGTAPDIGADEGNFVPLTCFPIPSAPTGTPTSPTAANLSWSAAVPAPSNGYEWEVRTSGLPGTGGATVSGTTGAGVLTDATGNTLTANTLYSLYVRSYCGGTDYSTWSNAGTFTTPCTPVNVPWSENFNGVGAPNIPSCQLVINEGAGNAWVTSATAVSGLTGNHLRYTFNSSNPANTWYFSTPLSLTGGVTYTITYKYGITSTTWTESMKIAFGTARNGAAMTNVIVDYPSLNATTAIQNGSNTFTPPSTGTYYIGFQSYSATDQNVLVVDDISVLPPCVTPAAQPTSLTSPSQGPSSISLSFTPASGVDSFLVVRYLTGATATAPTSATIYLAGDALGAGVVVGKTNSAASINALGLAPNTTYDFYIYSFNNNCVGGPLYRTTSPLTGSFTTAACAGPISAGTYAIGPTGTYNNLNEAFAFIVNCGVSGAVVLELLPAYVPSSEVFPVAIGNIAGASSTNTITIRPAPTTPSVSWTASSSSALIDLNGAKFVSFDGRPGGTGTSRLMSLTNSGSGPAFRFINNAQGVTLRNLNIQASNPTVTSGVIEFSNTTGTAITDGNSNNTITNCGISGNGVSPNGIYAAGKLAPADNKSNTISNNDIYDYFSNAASTNRNAGIALVDHNGVSAGAGWTISGNNFYQTTSRTFSTMTSGVHAIYISPSAVANGGVFTISNNKLGGTATNLGGSALTYSGTTFTFQGFYVGAGTQGTTTVSGNTISNIAITSTSTSTSTIAGIYAPTGNSNISSNVIGSATTPGALTYGGGSGTFFGIHTSGLTSTNTALNITNNTIAGITLTGTAATGCMGIGLSATATYSGPCSITGNNIGTAAAGITSTVTGAVTSLIWGISQLNAATFTITGNTITNFSSVATGSSTANQFRGINATGTGVNIIGATGAGNKNVISNFTLAAPNTGTGASASIVGINLGATSTGQAIINNEISGLRNTSTLASSINVVGIVTGNITTGSGEVRLNRVWDLTNTSTGASSIIIGIVPTATSGTWTYANNMISLVNGANTNAVEIRGINDNSAGGTRNYYFNTVNIGGSSTAGALNSHAFFRGYSTTLTNISVQNNLLVNSRTGGTGNHYALTHSYTSAPPTTGWTSGYNVLNAPNTAKIAVWGIIGTNDRTFASYKAVSGSTGGYSNISVPFVNAANGDLHVNYGATATALESGGDIGTTAITTDFDGDARPGPAGSVRGGGTSADIGADEFDGASLSVNVGAIAVALPSSPCLTNSETVSIRIKNFSTSTALNYGTNNVVVSGTITNPALVGTPFTVTLSSGSLLANATSDITVLTGYDMSATGNYTIVANATTGADEDVSNDDMGTVTKTKTVLAAGTISANTTAYCVTSGRPILTIAGSTGGDIQWQDSATNTAGVWVNVGTVNALTYQPASNLTATRYFRAVVTCGTSVTTNRVTVSYSNPILSSYTATKTRCGAGTVTLNATANAGSTINWYATATGAVVATGPSYTTGILANDTIVYVNTSAGGSNSFVSELAPEPASTGTTLTTYTQDFTVTTGFTLNSIQVFSTTGTSITVSLYSALGATQLQTTGANAVTAGSSPTINLGWYIAPGTYRLSANGMTGSFIRDNTGVTYPFTLPGIGTMNGFTSSITGSVTTSSSYYFLYNWSVTTACETPRQAVNITLTAPPALALSTNDISMCSGVPSATVSVTPATVGNYTLYSWSGTTGERQPGSTPNGSTVVFTGTNATNTATTQFYKLTAAGGGPGGLCGNQATIAVTINPRPTSPVTTGTAVCLGGTATNLTALSTPTSTLIGGSVPITFTNSVSDEGASWPGKVVGSFTLPALPAGAVFHSARIIANGVFGQTDPTNGQTFGSEIRLGIRTAAGVDVTTTGYQGTTVTTSPNPFDYATLRTNADSTTIGSLLPAAGGSFRIVYYETLNDLPTDQDAIFPATGTLTYLYSFPTTYNWYTSNYTGTLLGTGSTFNPVGVAGSGLANTNTPGNYTYWAQASNNVCTSPLPRTAAVYSIVSRPVPTFTAGATSTTCANTTVVYTTQSGRTNYTWTVTGVNNVDYQVTAGALSTSSNTVTIRWITPGAKTVTINYSNGSCAGTTAASNNTTVLAVTPVSVTISGATTTCYGGAVTYTATPTSGGTNPIYQWKKDGSNVGTNSATYVDPGTTGGVITCDLTSNSPCISGSPTATSNSITLAVTPNTWTGTVSTDFGNPGNWCAGVVPSGAANISIPSGPVNMPQLRRAFSFNNLNLDAGASLDLNGNSLTLLGTISGAGTIKGTIHSVLVFTGTGSIGTLNMDATANSLKVLNLTGSGGATLTLGNALNIMDSVDVNANTLATGGFLTLKSVQSGTGRVGEILPGGSVTGNVTVERWIRNVSRRTWKLLSVPTQGSQSIKQGWMENQAPNANGNPGYGTIITGTSGLALGYDATTTENSIMVWDPSSATFSFPGSSSTPLATTGGYYLFVRGDRSVPASNNTTVTVTTLRSNGTLYQGTQSALTANAGEHTIVGNIYASAIDFLELQKTGITSFKIWDPLVVGSSSTPTVASGGAYQTFSAANGWVPTPGGGSYSLVATNTRIESGQAFVVSPTSAGTITFTEVAKTTGSRQLVRGNNVIQRFKANLATTSGTSFNILDGNVTVFDNLYSHGVDDYDALKMNNFKENFGISNSGRVFTIDARPEIGTTDDEIQYNMTNLDSKIQYTLEFVSENLDPSIRAYLIDNYLNTQTAISLNTTQTFNFTINDNVASYASNRFKVIFKPSATLPVSFTTVRANEQNGNVLVNWGVASEKNIRHYVVEHSTDSRTFKEIGTVKANANGALSAEYKLLHEYPTSGSNYYRIRSVGIGGDQKNSNIVKVDIGGIKSGYVVSPNPITDAHINVQFVNQPAGQYALRFVNSVGQLLYAQNINHEGGNSSYRIRLASTLAGGMYKLHILQPNKTQHVQNLIVSNGE